MPNTPVIVRKNFNGGFLTPELWYRSDLQAYENSCRQVDNVIGTPWGSAKRRPPSQLISKLDRVPLKYIPFKFSDTETFHVVLCEPLDGDIADMVVYNDDGEAQILSSDSVTSIPTTLSVDDAFNIHFIQVNDFIYGTNSDGKYYPWEINRYYDSTLSSNRWSWREQELIGPFDEENTVDENLIQIIPPLYDGSFSYDEGDVAYDATSVSISSLSSTQAGWDFNTRIPINTSENGYVEYEEYNLTIELNEANQFDVGDTVKVDNLVFDEATATNAYSSVSTNPSFRGGYVGDVSGSYKVIGKNGNILTLDKKAYTIADSSEALPTANIVQTVLDDTNAQGVSVSFYPASFSGQAVLGPGNPSETTYQWQVDVTSINNELSSNGGGKIDLSFTIQTEPISLNPVFSTSGFAPSRARFEDGSSIPFTGSFFLASGVDLNPNGPESGSDVNTLIGAYISTAGVFPDTIKFPPNSSPAITYDGPTPRLYINDGTALVPRKDFGISKISQPKSNNGVTTPVFYRSKSDSNSGNALNNTTYWEPIDAYKGEIQAIASQPIWSPCSVGRQFRLKTDTDFENNPNLKGEWTSDNTSFGVIAQGTVVLTTADGVWRGTLSLQESGDGGLTWETIGQIISQNETNGILERTIVGADKMVRVKLEDYQKTRGQGYPLYACAWTLEFSNPVYEYYEVLEYVSDYVVNAYPISPVVRATATDKWSLGTYYCTNNPFTLTIFDERMTFGGTPEEPSTVWTSRAFDFVDFTFAETTDVDGYKFTLNKDSFEQIRWLKEKRNLVIGTDQSETILDSADGNAVTATNVAAKTQTNYGSKNIQALNTADQIFFVQTQGDRVRNQKYDFASDSFESEESSIFAARILEPKIKEMCYVRHPYSQIFFTMEDGSIASFIYERANKVFAWSKLLTEGTVVSAGSNFDENGDRLIAIVKRGNDYFLEEFLNDSSGTTIYLDNATTYTLSSGELSALNLGYELSSYDDYRLVVDDTMLPISSYSITNDVLSADPATLSSLDTSSATFGIPFTWTLVPNPPVEQGDYGRYRRLDELSLYLRDSGNVTVKTNEYINAFQSVYNLAKNERLSGEQKLEVGGGWDGEALITLSSDSHQHFEILAFGIHGEVSQ